MPLVHKTFIFRLTNKTFLKRTLKIYALLKKKNSKCVDFRATSMQFDQRYISKWFDIVDYTHVETKCAQYGRNTCYFLLQ